MSIRIGALATLVGFAGCADSDPGGSPDAAPSIDASRSADANEPADAGETPDASPSATWIEETRLIASDGRGSDFFGWSVAVSGDTALMGSWGATVDGIGAQGAAYVFTRTDGVWTEQAKLTASDGEEIGAIAFGWAVDLSDDTAVIGAPCHPLSGCPSPGAAYVFSRSGGTWTETAKLTPSDGALGDFFGISVALADQTVLVGAPDAEVGAGESQGKAYVFARTDDTWTQQAQLAASDGAALDRFGGSVSVSGDLALVGAADARVGDNADQGAAYAFVRTGATWTEEARLTASDGAAQDAFGDVAVYGDTAVVGAFFADVEGDVDQGAAYVFVRSDLGWSEQAKLIALDGTFAANFGAVAIVGDTALVGAPRHQVEPGVANGQAYVFARADGSWSQTAQFTVEGAAQLGFSVAISGDETLVLGAPSTTVGETPGQGIAQVFARSDDVAR